MTALWLALGTAIVAIVVLAQFWITQRDRSARERVREILTARLAPCESGGQACYGSVLTLELERGFANTDLSSPNECAELRRSPLIRILVVVDREQQMLSYPSDLRNAMSEDRSLIEETQQLLRDRFPKMPSASNVNNVMLEEANYFASQLAALRRPLSQRPSQTLPQISSSQNDLQSAPAQRLPLRKEVTAARLSSQEVGLVWIAIRQCQGSSAKPLADLVSSSRTDDWIFCRAEFEMAGCGCVTSRAMDGRRRCCAG